MDSSKNKLSLMLSAEEDKVQPLYMLLENVPVILKEALLAHLTPGKNPNVQFAIVEDVRWTVLP
jgi:hypothetical protein